MLLSAEFAMSVAQIAVDATASDRVTGIIGVGQREALERTEMGLDEVQPRGVGGGPHRVDAKPLEQREEARVVMSLMQVIHDDVELLPGVAAAQPLERLEQFGQALALVKHPIEAVGVDIVEAEEELRALEPVVGGAHALGLVARRPGHPTDRLDLQWPPFVEAHYRGARRAAPVERSDAFFLLSKSGSCERFQVRMRCALRPSRRNSRRTHSSVTDGSNRLARQYSASFGTDQLENGSPRSSGLDRATSTSSRSCSPLRIGGRPFGLGTCSKVAKPLWLNRCTQSYAAVKWQPTRSAASTTLWPLRTSSMTR